MPMTDDGVDQLYDELTPAREDREKRRADWLREHPVKLTRITLPRFSRPAVYPDLGEVLAPQPLRLV